MLLLHALKSGRTLILIQVAANCFFVSGHMVGQFSHNHFG